MTSACKSILSNNGPDILFKYFCTEPGGHKQSLLGWLKKPQGQGFIDAISIKLAGKSTENLALDIVIHLSSNGCRITSKTVLLNSGN